MKLAPKALLLDFSLSHQLDYPAAPRPPRHACDRRADRCHAPLVSSHAGRQGATAASHTASQVGLPDAGFNIHTSAWDEENRAATFFATYHLRHTGEGGPVPPTNREMNSHYVFVLFMSAADRVEKMYKIWNADWAFTQLGWA